MTTKSEVNMYYVNVETLKFCLPDSPDKAGDKPQFRHTESKAIDIMFLRSDGSPVDLTGATLTLAMDNNYCHEDKLVAFSEGDRVQILNPESGIVRFFIDCNSSKFERLVRYINASVKIEVVLIPAGETEERTILHDKGILLLPRIRTSEGAPADASPDYYSKTQIDAMLAGIARVELPACSGMGYMIEDNGVLLTWIDPEDVTLNGSVLARWNRTVLVRKIGTYPESPEDGVIVAQTSRADATKNKYRSDGFHDTEREAGTTYYYKLFSQTTGGVWNNQDANRYAETTSMSWGMVQSFVRAGRGPELWPIGTVFVVDHPEYTHADGTGLWFRVVGHDQMQAADETLAHSMCLDMVDCLFSALYDAAEAPYALTADETAQALKTYYTLSGTEYTALVEGTDYNIGDPVPTASWYEKNSLEAYQGSSDPEENNLIRWANSDGAANQWFFPATIWDVCHSTFLQKNGFLRHLDPEFRAVVTDARLFTNVYRHGKTVLVEHMAKFFCLSKTQISGESVENIQLDYYKTADRTKTSIMDPSTKTLWRVRTVSNASSCYAVSTRGDFILGYQAQTGISFACIIA